MLQFFAIALALVASVQAVNPDPNAIQIEAAVKVPDAPKRYFLYNTTTLLDTIQKRLHNYDHGMGIPVRIRKNDVGCLDVMWINASPPMVNISAYRPFLPGICKDTSPTQQWRYVDGAIQVGDKINLNKLHSTPCLNCQLGKADCLLEVVDCQANDQLQQYFFRIHTSQFDCAHQRIYFSIHNKAHPASCLTSFHNNDIFDETYHLQDCHGGDDQSFYLPSVDFSKESQDVCTHIKNGA